MLHCLVHLCNAVHILLIYTRTRVRKVRGCSKWAELQNENEMKLKLKTIAMACTRVQEYKSVQREVMQHAGAMVTRVA